MFASPASPVVPELSVVPELPVMVIIPGLASYVRVVRLVVSSVAADMGFDFDEVEDLRIVADELVSAAINATSPGSPVCVSLSKAGSALSFEISAPLSDPLLSGEGLRACLDPLATQIVSALVETFSIDSRDSEISVTCTSREPGGGVVAI